MHLQGKKKALPVPITSKAIALAMPISAGYFQDDYNLVDHLLGMNFNKSLLF
jgi:hypothetical protein